jgi:hypothetical protein
MHSRGRDALHRNIAEEANAKLTAPNGVIELLQLSAGEDWFGARETPAAKTIKRMARAHDLRLCKPELIEAERWCYATEGYWRRWFFHFESRVHDANGIMCHPTLMINFDEVMACPDGGT